MEGSEKERRPKPALSLNLGFTATISNGRSNSASTAATAANTSGRDGGGGFSFESAVVDQPSKMQQRRSKRNLPALTLESNLVQDNLPMQILPQVSMGSIHCAFNQEGLTDHQITHILNISGMPATFPHQFLYLNIDLRDKEYSNILSCIPVTNIFIQAAVESGGNVLVHCAGGRSRSAALLIAYMMYTEGHPFPHAYSHVKSKRSVVSLNAGFEQQLMAYGQCKCDVYAAHQTLLQKRMREMAMLKRNNASKEVLGKTLLRKTGRERYIHPKMKKHRSKRRNKGDDGKSSHAGNDGGHGQVQLGSSESAGAIEKYGANDRQAHKTHKDNKTTALVSDECMKKNFPCPRVRLQRPGSPSVQVLPPLRGMDHEYVCRRCRTPLFSAASIIRQDLHVPVEAESMDARVQQPEHGMQTGNGKEKRQSGNGKEQKRDDAGGAFEYKMTPRGTHVLSSHEHKMTPRGTHMLPFDTHDQTVGEPKDALDEHRVEKDVEEDTAMDASGSETDKMLMDVSASLKRQRLGGKQGEKGSISLPGINSDIGGMKVPPCTPHDSSSFFGGKKSFNMPMSMSMPMSTSLSMGMDNSYNSAMAPHLMSPMVPPTPSNRHKKHKRSWSSRDSFTLAGQGGERSDSSSATGSDSGQKPKSYFFAEDDTEDTAAVAAESSGKGKDAAAIKRLSITTINEERGRGHAGGKQDVAMHPSMGEDDDSAVDYHRLGTPGTPPLRPCSADNRKWLKHMESLEHNVLMHSKSIKQMHLEQQGNFEDTDNTSSTMIRAKEMAAMDEKVAYGHIHSYAHSSNNRGFANSDINGKVPNSKRGGVSDYVFIEPMSWMADDIAGARGHILCPHEQCRLQLGSWDWDGLSLPDGSTMAPAFRVQLSRTKIVEHHFYDHSKSFKSSK